ncbi:MAG: DUF1365 family protein [Pseudohongiellaceae bacterium]|jgi:DUF1365 family protein
MNSAVYRGRVRHRRFEPVQHVFEYDLFMLYLDLDELDSAFDGRRLWSVNKPNLASFRREDYLGPPEVPLREAVLARVAEVAGQAPNGPVRMLTHLRYFGFCFNPVSFYYCFDEHEQLAAIVAEITNTPWRQRHAYVLTREDSETQGGGQLWTFPKAFHISPFMDMEQQHRWRFDEPGEQLTVSMQNLRDERVAFDVMLSMERQELTGSNLARCLLLHPCMTGKALAGIYWQALRLALKRVPFHTHPEKLSERAP